MIESNENLINSSYNDENYSSDEYTNYNLEDTNYNVEDINSSNYKPEDTVGCKVCLDPIFFEPNKFITADFEIEVRNLCPGSRIAIVVEVRRNLPGYHYKTLATVHDIFNVPNCNHPHRPCTCQTVTRVFRDVILDLNPTESRNDDPCHNLNVNDLTVVVVKSNYISRKDSYCHF